MSEITELKNEVENSLRTFKFQILSEEEMAKRTAEAEAEANREAAAKIIANAGLPERLKRALTPIGDGWLKVDGRLKARAGSGFIIALCGPRGTGKTQLAGSLARFCAGSGRSVIYKTAMSIFLDIQATFGGKGSTEKVLSALTAPKVLIIDEAQERGETPWEDRLLGHLIDRRYGAMRDTLLLSNQTKVEFLKSIGDSVASRIVETGGIAVCDWPSYRN